MAKITPGEQAWTAQYIRAIIEDFRSAADEAESLLDDGAPVLTVWPVVSKPITEVMSHMTAAVMRGPPP